MNNKKLTEEICKHLLYNFGANKNISTSIFSQSFLLSEKISFQGKGGVKDSVDVWGAESIISEKKLLVLATQFASHGSEEIFLYVKYDKSPAYCIFKKQNELIKSANVSKIFFLTEGSENWIECDIYLQACLLAAMEEVKKMMPSLGNAKIYKSEFNNFTDCIEHCWSSHE